MKAALGSASDNQYKELGQSYRFLSHWNNMSDLIIVADAMSDFPTDQYHSDTLLRCTLMMVVLAK